MYLPKLVITKGMCPALVVINPNLHWSTSVALQVERETFENSISYMLYILCEKTTYTPSSFSDTYSLLSRLWKCFMKFSSSWAITVEFLASLLTPSGWAGKRTCHQANTQNVCASNMQRILCHFCPLAFSKMGLDGNRKQYQKLAIFQELLPINDINGTRVVCINPAIRSGEAPSHNTLCNVTLTIPKRLYLCAAERFVVITRSSDILHHIIHACILSSFR